jgi:putative ABC transport system permease protein
VDSIETITGRVAGVSAAEAWTGLRASLVHDSAMLGNAFSVLAPPAGTRLFVPRVEEGRWIRSTDENALVVSTSLAKREPAFRLGARVPLSIDDRAVSWTVVGIADAGPIPAAYTSREIVNRFRGSTQATTVVVATSFTGVGSQVELIQRVRAELDRAGLRVSSSQLLEETRRVTEDHLLMVVDFLAVMGWVMIVVGGMGLASTMSLAVLERTREIGVMRTIGARQTAILGMVQVEGLVIAIASWAVALPLSIPLSVVLAKAFGRVMMEVPVTYLPARAGVAGWLGLVVAISIVACAWPAARAMRVTVARALAYE